jgi:hypothetical protein
MSTLQNSKSSPPNQPMWVISESSLINLDDWLHDYRFTIMTENYPLQVISIFKTFDD